MADPVTAPKTTKPATKRAERRPFAAIVNDVRQYCELKLQILKEISGPDITGIDKARCDELSAVLARLGPKDGK